MKQLLQISLLFICTITIAQNRFENKAYGFSISEPDGWLWGNNADLDQNRDKLKLDDKALLKIINDHKGSLLLLSMYKYDPQTHIGLIPALQVNVREKRNKEFSVFKSYIVKSAHSFKELYPDYEYIDTPQETTINGIKSLYFSGKFTMKTQAGQQYRVRNRIYVIPHGSYYFQLTFTDGIVSEDCTKEFEALVNSIQIAQ